MKDKQNYEFEKEFYAFYCMCGEKDRDFFDTPRKYRQIEDYVRLSYIALAFGFKNMAINIFQNLGNKKSEKKFYHFWTNIRKDAPTAIKWFDDFIENISVPELKTLAAEVWEEAKKKTDQEDFDMSNLIY